MKRTKPLRRTPFRSRAVSKSAPATVRRGHEPRPERKPRRSPAAVPPPVSEEEAHTRAVVEQRSDGFCEKCGAPGATDKAHRVSRGVGGEWDPANILDLCRACHSYHHRHPTTAYRGGWHLPAESRAEDCPVLFHHNGVTGVAYLRSDGSFEWASEAA